MQGAALGVDNTLAHLTEGFAPLVAAMSAELTRLGGDPGPLADIAASFIVKVCSGTQCLFVPTTWSAGSTGSALRLCATLCSCLVCPSTSLTRIVRLRCSITPHACLCLT